MPNQQHTPGDWTTKPENEYLPAQVWADGRLLADVFGESREARAANARVMAAAPKMLEALREMVANLISTATLGLNDAEVLMLKRAEAAIASTEPNVPCDK